MILNDVDRALAIVRAGAGALYWREKGDRVSPTHLEEPMGIADSVAARGSLTAQGCPGSPAPA